MEIRDIPYTNSSQYQEVLQDIFWMGGVLKRRMEDFFSNKHAPVEINNSPMAGTSPYAKWISGYSTKERLLLSLVLAPVLSPAYLDALMHENLPKSGDYPQVRSPK